MARPLRAAAQRQPERPLRIGGGRCDGERLGPHPGLGGLRADPNPAVLRRVDAVPWRVESARLPEYRE